GHFGFSHGSAPWSLSLPESNLSLKHYQALFPAERASGLIFDDTCLKKVAFLFEVDHFRHPRKWIFLMWKQCIDADLLATPIGDEAQVGLEHRRVQAQYAAGHRVFRIRVLKLDGLLEQLRNFFAEGRRPEMRVFELDGVDEVDTEIAVHRFIAQDVHVLFGRSRHLVLAAQCQDLREADVEKQAFHQAGEYDERLQQRLIRLRRARLEVRIRDCVDERNQELILCTYRRDLVIRVEDLGLIQA